MTPAWSTRGTFVTLVVFEEEMVFCHRLYRQRSVVIALLLNIRGQYTAVERFCPLGASPRTRRVRAVSFPAILSV